MTRIVVQDGSSRDLAVGETTAYGTDDAVDRRVWAIWPDPGYGEDKRRDFRIDELGNDVVRIWSPKVSSFLAKAEFDQQPRFESDGSSSSTWWKKEWVTFGPGFMLSEYDNSNYVLAMLGPETNYTVNIRTKSPGSNQVWVFQ